jgi:hypothetical protein
LAVGLRRSNNLARKTQNMAKKAQFSYLLIVPHLRMTGACGTSLLT